MTNPTTTRAEVEELAAKVNALIAENSVGKAYPGTRRYIKIYEEDWPALAATLPPQAAPEWTPTHQHYKGGFYRKIGDGIHTETNEPLTFYEDQSRRLFARPKAMFDEAGRFTPIIAQAAPEGKPDFEQVATEMWAELDTELNGAPGTLSHTDTIAYLKKQLERIWAAASHKAALEAEARVAEMREALDWATAAIRHYQNALSILGKIVGGKTLFEHSPSQNTECLLAWQNLDAAGKKAQLALRKADAIPNPSGDRFMKLLEAAHQAQNDLAQVGDGLEAQGIGES